MNATAAWGKYPCAVQLRCNNGNGGSRRGDHSQAQRSIDIAHDVAHAWHDSTLRCFARRLEADHRIGLWAGPAVSDRTPRTALEIFHCPERQLHLLQHVSSS